MYESHWGLAAKPFEDSADSRFYYPSEGHQGALLKLRYAVENRRGGALVVGAPGLGKTLLVRALSRQLPETIQPVIRLVFPQLSPAQFIRYLAHELGGHCPDDAATDRDLQRIRMALRENWQRGKHLLFVVEEAHLLKDSETLETIRLLMNLEHDATPAMTVLLVGQPSLLPVLRHLPELEERLDAKCLLQKFNIEESVSYIQHRLTVAGAMRQVFDDSALESMHHLSQGTPRRINRLGDLALLLGYAEELSLISARHIEALAEEMLLPFQD
jgi:general secretion pathway protein A